MRHWIVGGLIVLVTTVLVLRSRTGTRQTIAPPTSVPASSTTP